MKRVGSRGDLVIDAWPDHGTRAPLRHQFKDASVRIQKRLRALDDTRSSWDPAVIGHREYLIDAIVIGRATEITTIIRPNEFDGTRTVAEKALYEGHLLTSEQSWISEETMRSLPFSFTRTTDEHVMTIGARSA